MSYLNCTIEISCLKGYKKAIAVFLSHILWKGNCKNSWKTWSESSILQELDFANCKNDENLGKQKFANANLENLSILSIATSKSQNLILAKNLFP